MMWSRAATSLWPCLLLLVLVGCGSQPKEPSDEAKTAGDPSDPYEETPPATEVFVNGTELSPAQMLEIEQVYGVRPLPGRYWYDARSGLYGAEGHAAYGFMNAYHPFGMPGRDASRGDTGVFVNGRELPYGEWLVWSRLLGVPIQQGSYWLDDRGNAGNEGNPVPTVNLYLAAQQTGYADSGGGDHFWSGRFSAGNYDAGNERGYVSVPGYGPVGYGF